MKKTNSKKLALGTETLVVLKPGAMDGVAGGNEAATGITGPTRPIGVCSCYTTFPTTPTNPTR
jgi:hypothetical protein